jgi:hypothetical protein
MGVLTCKLFTKPPNQALERCAEKDAHHITTGSVGEHVRRIQVALNELSNVFLIPDGKYGNKTANAVVSFKEAQTPPLRQPGQRIADNIVGIRTVKALDKQMKDLEDAPEPLTGFISLTPFGSPHDHVVDRRCDHFLDSEDHEVNGKRRIRHDGTPINPQGFRRKICLGGTNEVKYLGFENFVPDPKEDPAMQPFFVQGRPFTSAIADHTVSDLCLRSAPLDRFMQGNDPRIPGRKSELKRIALPGCRVTMAGNVNEVANAMPFLITLGPQIQSAIIHNDPSRPDPFDIPGGMHVVVFSVLNLG